MCFRSTIILGIAVMWILACSMALAETPEQRDARMRWFREARFGLFIHWGIYSVPAGEWEGNKDHGEWIMEQARIPASRYEKFAAEFNPVKFDARQWVRMAKDAGMKYVVITSKHHDGFCMFDTKLTDYNVMHTPFARDPMKELAQACKEEGLTFCFYHSIMDWHHPLYAPRRAWNDTAAGEPSMDRYVEHMKGQLKELTTNYGPIGILWFDGHWEKTWTTARGRDLYDYVRSLQPGIIVNNRVGGPNGDYETPEQQIPGTGLPGGGPWETCMTMNAHWGYNQYDHQFKPTKQIIRMLVDIASKGGNFLLNVGPTSEGLIPQESIDRLREVGQWTKANGEAIYGTTAGSFKKLAWGRCTQRPGKLYLHVFDWPTDGKLLVPISAAIKNAHLLAEPSQALSTASGSEGVTVQLPPSAPDENVSVVALELEGPPTVLPPQPVRQAADGTITLRAEDYESIGNARIETIDGIDSVGYWTDPSAVLVWQFQVDKPGTFEVVLTTACKPEHAGAPYFIAVGDHQLQGKGVATKSWDDFTNVSPGKLTIDRAGLTRLTIKQVEKHEKGVMNVRAIVLKPTGN
jgi:alpha-L-fucosidase